jgi:hypothetical protein
MVGIVRECFELTRDILRGVNSTIWGGAEGVEKASQIIKTSLTGSDAIIGTSWALEDLQCQDYVCCTLDIIGSTSSTIGLVLGNIPETKKYTKVTTSITGVCRVVRVYCKNYGTFWGCTAAGVEGILTGAKIIIKNKK